MKTTVLVLFVFLAFMLPGWAEEEPQPTLEATIETRVFTGGGARVESHLIPKLVLPISKGLRLFLEGRLELDWLRWGTPQRQGRFDMDLLNAFIEWQVDPWLVRLGQQIIELGKIDAISPLNIWGPRDLRDYLAEAPLGSLAASIQLEIPDAATHIRLLFSPTPAGHHLPHPGSPWWPGLTVEVEEGKLAGSAFGLEASHRFGDLDVSFLAIRHTDLFPTYAPTLTGLREEFVPETVVGGSLQVPVAGWTLTGEIAHHFYDDQSKADYTAAAVQAERIFDLDPNRSVVLDVGFATNSGSTGASFDYPFKDAPFVSVSYSQLDFDRLEEIWKLRVLGSGSSGWYLNPEWGKDLNSDVRVTIGADILGGSKESFFGTFRGNSRVYLKSEVKF